MISDDTNLGANDSKTIGNPSDSTTPRGEASNGDERMALAELGVVASPSSSLLFVQPKMGQGLSLLTSSATQPVMDVRGYLAQRAEKNVRFPSWELERPLFNRLGADLRADVREAQRAMEFVLKLTQGRHGLKVQPACLRALSVYPRYRPLKTFRAKYDLWRKSQDWLVLVNRARAGLDWQAGERGLPDAFLDYVAARMGDYKRGDAGEQAILSIHRQWQTGRNHKGAAEVIKGYEVGWESRQTNLLPDGWTSTNIRRQLKRKNAFSKAVKALRHEGSAAARAFVPLVHGTREGLRFMEEVQFDDVRCDFEVIDLNTGQICDLWLLIARDVATGMLLGFAMRPALARDDGKQDHLKLQDMKQLFGWLLETYGLPPWQATFTLERGTATLEEAVRAALNEMLGDRVRFHINTMIGGKSSTGYREKGVGNSKSKAMLECLNRLQHIMTSHFPGQIGLNYGKRPQDQLDRRDEARQIWQSHRAEDRAELVYPVLTVAQSREKLTEVFRLMNHRTDHNHEGFEQVVEVYDAEANKWTKAYSGRAGSPLPAESGAIGTSRPTRVRMESPVERAGRLLWGCEPFTRVSPEILTAFYFHTQRSRPVEDNGEITLTHEGKLLRFAPPTSEFALKPETKCLCYFNPDDPRYLTLTDGRGGILGTWMRRGLVKHGDADALAAAIRYSTTALNAARDRATELAELSGENLALRNMREHNAGFVTVVEPRSQSKELRSPVAGALATISADSKAAKLAAKDRLSADEELMRKYGAAAVDAVLGPSTREEAHSEDVSDFLSAISKPDSD